MPQHFNKRLQSSLGASLYCSYRISVTFTAEASEREMEGQLDGIIRDCDGAIRNSKDSIEGTAPYNVVAEVGKSRSDIWLT